MVVPRLARITAALASAAVTAGAALASPATALLRTSPAGIVVEVVPAAADLRRALSAEGPRTSGFLVVLPPGARPALRVLADESLPLAGSPPSPEVVRA